MSQIDPVIAAFLAGGVFVAIVLLTRREATDPGRDSTAITRCRTEERTSAVYVVLQSPSEVRHIHEGEITVRHEVAGAVRHTHAHQHTHTLAASDGSGYERLPDSTPPRRSLSALDSPSYRQQRIGAQQPAALITDARREYADRY